MRRSAALLPAAAVALAALSAVPSPLGRGTAAARDHDDDALLALPLALHVPGAAEDDHARALLDALARAYGPHGICFVPTLHALPDDRRELRTIRERRALRALLVPRAANALLVDRMHDPHPSESTRRTAARHGFEPTGLLGGAHVPAAAGHRPATYVIVTRDGGPLTLAHELGHFLGAGHHPDPANIMSYGRDRRAFDAAQVRVFRARARRALARHELSRPDAAACATGEPL
jgi:hypothetical protein